MQGLRNVPLEIGSEPCLHGVFMLVMHIPGRTTGYNKFCMSKCEEVEKKNPAITRVWSYMRKWEKSDCITSRIVSIYGNYHVI